MDPLTTRPILRKRRETKDIDPLLQKIKPVLILSQKFPSNLILRVL